LSDRRADSIRGPPAVATARRPSIASRRRNLRDRAAGELADLDELPVVAAQDLVEELEEPRDLLLVLADDRVEHLREEADEGLVQAALEVRTPIVEDSVVGPLPVVHSVLVDVAGGVGEPSVARPDPLQIPGAADEGSTSRRRTS